MIWKILFYFSLAVFLTILVLCVILPIDTAIWLFVFGIMFFVLLGSLCFTFMINPLFILKMDSFKERWIWLSLSFSLVVAGIPFGFFILHNTNIIAVSFLQSSLLFWLSLSGIIIFLVGYFSTISRINKDYTTSSSVIFLVVSFLNLYFINSTQNFFMLIPTTILFILYIIYVHNNKQEHLKSFKFIAFGFLIFFTLAMLYQTPRMDGFIIIKSSKELLVYYGIFCQFALISISITHRLIVLKALKIEPKQIEV